MRVYASPPVAISKTIVAKIVLSPELDKNNKSTVASRWVKVAMCIPTHALLIVLLLQVKNAGRLLVFLAASRFGQFSRVLGLIFLLAWWGFLINPHEA